MVCRSDRRGAASLPALSPANVPTRRLSLSDGGGSKPRGGCRGAGVEGGACMNSATMSVTEPRTEHVLDRLTMVLLLGFVAALQISIARVTDSACGTVRLVGRAAYPRPHAPSRAALLHRPRGLRDLHARLVRVLRRSHGQLHRQQATPASGHRAGGLRHCPRTTGHLGGRAGHHGGRRQRTRRHPAVRRAAL